MRNVATFSFWEKVAQYHIAFGETPHPSRRLKGFYFEPPSAVRQTSADKKPCAQASRHLPHQGEGNFTTDLNFLFTTMDYKKAIPKNERSKILSRNLRKNATKEENHLWFDFLKSYPIQFHRQYVIEKFIVDFFCPKARLIIEIDGSQHYYSGIRKYDDNRTNILKTYGFTVLRYTNIEINQKFESVCADIHQHVENIIGYNPFEASHP